MGSRGASFNQGRYPYGTEYKSIYQSGNIKFVEYIKAGNTKSPLETQTKGRIYVTLDQNKEPKYITYYDKNNKRSKQIDITGVSHIVEGERVLPHTHKGYFHDEKGTYRLSGKEKKMLERVMKIWENK